MTPITFAHRGARADAPENTLPAFRRALERGARGLESDAWLSADGEVVLVHDPVVRDRRRRLRVGESTARRLAELGVPRLVDLYDDVGTDYELSIDLKDTRAALPMLTVAEEAGAGERLWVCSPDLEPLHELRERSGDVKLVHSTSRRAVYVPLERHAADLAEASIDALNMHHSEWTAGLVALFHRFDVAAFAWDVQEVRQLHAVLRMKVDGLYCDHVDRMVATIAEWAAGPGR